MPSGLVSDAALGVVLFTSTNLDDLFVLLLFFSSASFRKSEVIAGQFLGIFVLVLGSVALATAAVVLPKTVLGLLGLVPIGVGLRLFFLADRTPEPSAKAKSIQTGLLAVTAVTVANGSDNVAVYVPVFAVQAWQGIVAVAAVFVIMTAVWCWIAGYVGEHPQLSPPLRRYGQRLLPWGLVAIGLHVVWTSLR